MLSKKVGLNTVAYYSDNPHDSVVFEGCPDESGGTTVMSIPFESLKELINEISAACDNTHAESTQISAATKIRMKRENLEQALLIAVGAMRRTEKEQCGDDFCSTLRQGLTDVYAVLRDGGRVEIVD